MWLAGLFGFLRHRRYRMMAFMYLVPLALFWIGKGRHYYMAGAYPMLLAMGAVLGERWLHSLPRWGRFTLATVYFAAFAFVSAFVCAIVLPLQSSGPLRNYALSHNGDLREEIGWDELVRTVAQIRDRSRPISRRTLASPPVITASTEPSKSLAPPMDSRNPSAPPTPNGSAAIQRLRPPRSSSSASRVSKPIQSSLAADWAGHNGNSEGVRTKKARTTPTSSSAARRAKPWPELWKDHQDFG